MTQRHFVTGSFTSHAFWMEENDYAKGLDNFVVTCADCIVLNSKGQMLLGKRTIEPQPDWWIAGGKMVPGETFIEAVVRNVKRELGLDIDGSRFSFLPGVYSLVWARRQQAPKDHGSHTVSITAVLQITDNEASAIKPNYEYAALQWIRPEEIDEHFHPALKAYAQDVITFFPFAILRK